MQQTSSSYKNGIKQSSRSFECRVTIGKNVYTNDNIVDIIIDYPQANEGYSIGNTVSQSLDLMLLNTGEQIYSTNQIKVEIGLKIGDTIEYVPMGYYNVDEVSKNDYTIKFTAFDNMIKFETPYFSSLGDTPTLKQVVEELVYITGVKFSGSIPSYTVKKLEGYTCREVLSYVASLCGGDALINREGDFTIVIPKNIGYTVLPDNHFGLTTEETLYKVGKLTCVVDGETELSKGSIGTDAMELAFENPWMTDNILNSLYNQLKSFSYLGYAVKWQGDLALEPGDIITITDRKGTEYQVPILSQKFTYTGGLTCELGAKGESKNKNSFSASGSNSNKVNRLVTEQAIIKEALITKANIQDLEAVSIRTQTLEATTARIEHAIIDVVYIRDLNAINAKIDELQTNDATIQNALINKADITELNAIKGTISNLEVDVAEIDNLIASSIISQIIQSGSISSDLLNIKDGFIKDAMIGSLSASKVDSGTINTNNVSIASDNGNMTLQGSLLQFKDKNSKVRIQIGQDITGNYTFTLYDSTGVGVLINQDGIQSSNAIKDGLIIDSKVASDANISGSKLNISSLYDSMNSDGSKTLKASKVFLDDKNQTLDVSFKQMTTKQDELEDTMSTAITDIEVAQGQISTLIQDTTITTSSGPTKLKDAYSSLKQTVDGIDSTVVNQQTTINEHSGQITSVNNEVSSLKQSVDGFTTTVTELETTFTERINTEVDNLVNGSQQILDLVNQITDDDTISEVDRANFELSVNQITLEYNTVSREVEKYDVDYFNAFMTELTTKYNPVIDLYETIQQGTTTGAIGLRNAIISYYDAYHNLLYTISAYTKDQLVQFSTKIDQTSKDVTTTISRLEVVEGVSTQVNNHMRFSDDWLELYSTMDGVNSGFKARLSNTQLSFYDGDTVVAYISNKTLNIENAIVHKELRIGNMILRPSVNGGIVMQYNQE